MNCTLTISPSYNTSEERPINPQGSSIHNVTFWTFQTKRISNPLCNQQVNQEVI